MLYDGLIPAVQHGGHHTVSPGAHDGEPSAEATATIFETHFIFYSENIIMDAQKIF